MIVYETNSNPTIDIPDHFKSYTYDVISAVAYLIGVPLHFFERESDPPKLEIFQKLENNKHARIVRHLCILRTAIERNYKNINTAMVEEYKGLSAMGDLVPIESLTQLSTDGIHIKNNPKLNEHLIDINGYITDRINNCKDLFPIWLEWNYLRNIFIMPNGLSENGLKDAANEYYANRNYYPYQMYMNWPPSDEGNILYNDLKFVTLLYGWNDDKFADFNKVSDASTHTKESIYDFIDMSENLVFVVDCENSDPYKLCATLRNLEKQYLEKVSKIILYDDVNSATAWRILGSYMDIPVEHILIERIKPGKSHLDINLTVGVSRECFQNCVDSFVLVSSDSDYWGLISSIPEARFLVMIESGKTGFDIKNALTNSGIFYCYIDDFYSGNSYEIKVLALLKEMERYLQQTVQANAKNMIEMARKTTRANLTEVEEKQFYAKYVKNMYIDIAENGEINIKFKT